MINEQAKRFKSIIDVTYQAFGKPPPERDMLKLWWVKLFKFEIAIIAQAFDSWIDSQKYPPVPADIVSLCSGYTNRAAQVARLSAPRINPAKSQQRVDELKTLTTQFGSKPRDYRAWANKIIANPKNYCAYAINLANQAIHAKMEKV